MASKLVVAALAAFCVAGTVQAQEAPLPFQLGLEVGASSVDSKVVEEDGDDPVFGVSLGYRVNRNFAVEVFGRSLSFRILDGLVSDDSYYPEGHQGIAAIGYLPINDSFAAFGRLGVGRTKMHSASASRADFSETDPSIGAGVQWDFARNFGLKLEATRFTKSDVTTTTLGLVFKF